MHQAEERRVLLSPTLKKYVTFMMLRDPVSLAKHSYPISGVLPTEGALYILNLLEQNVQRKHGKKSVFAWLCDSVIRGHRCCLGVRCPNVHVTKQAYETRRLWDKTYPKKGKFQTLCDQPYSPTFCLLPLVPKMHTLCKPEAAMGAGYPIGKRKRGRHTAGYMADKGGEEEGEGEEKRKCKEGASRAYTHKPYATNNSVVAIGHANWLTAVDRPNVRRLRETRMKLQYRAQCDQRKAPVPMTQHNSESGLNLGGLNLTTA